MKPAMVEVWYNRTTRDWVVEPTDCNGNTYGSEYCGDKQWAMSVAEGYGVPIARTTPTGERLK